MTQAGRRPSTLRWITQSARLPSTCDARLLCGRGFIVQALPQSGFPEPDTGDKKFNSRLVAPTTRSFALARLRRHREAFLDPSLPQRFLAGDGSGRLIAVK